MKKMFLLAFVAMVAIGASAQMNVWENGGLSAQYAIESVDSVTFGITSETPASGTGKDGITPLLKIENDYWYVSYDEGQTWQQEGRAKGKDGQDGDSMFQSVTQDENYVYFTLADGTVIKIAKGNGNSQSNDDFIFTITYDANGGEGIMQKDTFYYGCSQLIKGCNYTKEGYHCKKWNTKADGTGISYSIGRSIIIDKNITLYAQWYVNSGLENNYEWIDLGLSVKWATCNVGATRPEFEGERFAWGETQSKQTYALSTYKFYKDYKYTKYCTDSSRGVVDNKTTLELEDDAAYINMGGNWRMPTEEEWRELFEQCSWTEIDFNNKKCLEITSNKNGNTIVIPRVTQIGANGYYGDYHYWVNSLYDAVSSAKYLYNDVRDDKDPLYNGLPRYCGLYVRPVCP